MGAQLQGLGANPLIAQQPLSLYINPLQLAAAQTTNNQLLNAQNIQNVLGHNIQSIPIAAPTTTNNISLSGQQFSLFVFHLPEDIDDHGLLQLFAPYGAMRSNVMRHDTGRSRGFGFVHFNTRHEAQIAIDMMNGHQIGRKRLRVSFKREEPHNNHHQQQQQQQQQTHIIPSSTNTITKTE